LFLLFLSTLYSINPVVNDSDKKVAFILPHADDETIGAGGLISMLVEKGYRLHFDLMTSGNGIGHGTIRVDNYYNVRLPENVSEKDRKRMIREDSFKQVMMILNVNDYSMHHVDDGTLTTDEVYKVMEDLYLKEGYTVFYTTTGDRNPDHHACHEAMRRMQEKYPDLKYRQFPIYYYFYDRGITKPTEPLNSQYVDVNVDMYGNMKKRMFQVYYNINTILPSFYPRSDGVIGFGPERIYYNSI
jgi:LmbE family N-acetylglucosaminyl deacetylase